MSQQKEEELFGVGTKLSYYKVFHRRSNSDKILELSKILMHEFCYDYVKPTYGEKVKLCYMGTDSFIIYIKGGNIYEDIAEGAEIRFDTSNYE